MKKDKIFFDKKGLTSTSANHICNLAKEFIQESQSTVDNIELYSTTINLLGHSDRDNLRIGTSEDKFLLIPALLKDIAAATSLISWLREAIKARESLLREANSLTVEEWAKANDKEVPKFPEMDEFLTEDEYYSTLSVDQRNRYYSLEAKASVLGKYIHPTGMFALARKRFTEKISKPTAIEGSGRDTIIYHYTPSIPQEKVESMFFELQKQFRETQAELNSMKFECDKAIEESKHNAETKYAKEMAAYKAKNETILAEFAAYLSALKREIRDLKIIIPPHLTGIYEKINSLGKKA